MERVLEIDGDGPLSHVAIALGAVLEPAHAEKPAQDAGWFCLSCDQPEELML